MLRQEFMVRFLMVALSKSSSHLAEEDTEEGHFHNMRKMIDDHDVRIQETIKGAG